VGPDLTGRILGDFRVLRRLGQGGMGQVYLAEQLSLKRHVALKILKPELAADPQALKRFEAEAHAVARATHANIVQVYATGAADGFPYIALEHIDGRSLRDYVARKGPPDAALALHLMRQAAAALQRAAELGIIHRDVKPENILLTRKAEVKVADFGLSRVLEGEGATPHLTQTGVTLGTPMYMSPEQVEGRPLDPRTDIYSLGATFYFMLAGRPPFRGQNAFEVALQHVRAEPEPLAVLRPDLPTDLCAVVHKMMAKKREDRYQTGRDLLADLARLRGRLGGPRPAEATEALPSAPSGARPPAAASETAAQTTTTARAARPRRWLPWAMAATVLLAFAGGAAVGWWRLRGAARTTPPEPAAGDVGEAAALLLPTADREKFLLTAVEEYANPGDDPQRVRLGVGHCLELALFYLERNRLDDADRFFARLDNPAQAVKPYRNLGRLGHAIVLGLQDRAAESDDLFVQLLKEAREERISFGQLYSFNQDPKIRVWVSRALDHNFANAAASSGHHYPRQLEVLRYPPLRRPDDKAAGRGS
jgi:serine/threonine-protein kinase